MTKRAEYLALKEKIIELRAKECAIRNEVFKAETEACGTVSHLLDAWKDARAAAERAVRVKFTAQLNEAREMRYKIDDLQRQLNDMPECDHRYDNGTSALDTYYTFGSEMGDKPHVRCLTCEETWD